MGRIAVWCAISSLPLLATVSVILYNVFVEDAHIVLQPKRAIAPSPVLSGTHHNANTERTEKAVPKFDVVRIDPDGASVFAGRAAADTAVTVLANAVPIASTRADANGEWAIVIERKFSPGDYGLSLGSEGKTFDANHTVRVASARTQSVPTEQPIGASAAIPKPITFIYDEARFTSEGRQAVAALSDYIRSQRFPVVTLSGHADERGSQFYNIELSRQRLQAVVDYLRREGFAGELVLLAKGKIEPFDIPHREALAKHDVYQLDRRVEFHLAQ
jgi:outer membrane protein OmpA-like peptidoglycan-associated protein